MINLLPIELLVKIIKLNSDWYSITSIWNVNHFYRQLLVEYLFKITSTKEIYLTVHQLIKFPNLKEVVAKNSIEGPIIQINSHVELELLTSLSSLHTFNLKGEILNNVNLLNQYIFNIFPLIKIGIITDRYLFVYENKHLTLSNLDYLPLINRLNINIDIIYLPKLQKNNLRSTGKSRIGPLLKSVYGDQFIERREIYYQPNMSILSEVLLSIFKEFETDDLLSKLNLIKTRVTNSAIIHTLLGIIMSKNLYPSIRYQYIVDLVNKKNSYDKLLKGVPINYSILLYQHTPSILIKYLADNNIINDLIYRQWSCISETIN